MTAGMGIREPTAAPSPRHASPTRSSVTPGTVDTAAEGYRLPCGAMDVAIVGGTGAEGFGLALRLAGAGHHVTIGSRVAEKAAASAAEAKGVLGADAPIDGAVNAASVVGKAVVFVTVPFEGQAMIYEAINDAL